MSEYKVGDRIYLDKVVLGLPVNAGTNGTVREFNSHTHVLVDWDNGMTIDAPTSSLAERER